MKVAIKFKKKYKAKNEVKKDDSTKNKKTNANYHENLPLSSSANKINLSQYDNIESENFGLNLNETASFYQKIGENHAFLCNPGQSCLPNHLNFISLENQTSERLRVVINVGGIRFETYKKTLSLIDDTRLAYLNETNSEYDPIKNEFFYDRDPNSFLAILNYLRTGKLHAPQDVCGNLFNDEMNFWGITEYSIQPCCWTNFSSKRECDVLVQNLLDEFKEPAKLEKNESGEECENNLNVLEGGAAKSRKIEKRNRLVYFTKKNFQTFRTRIWKFLEEQNSSLAATIYFWISIVFLVMSILNFVLETSPIFRVPYEIATNKSLKRYERDALTVPHSILINIEFICNIFFTIEYVLRFLSSPDKLKFLKNPYNILEFLAIFPFFWPVEKLNADGVKIVTFGVKVHNFTEVFYVLRILKIFTIVPKHSGLRVLLLTLKNSIGELGLYLVMLIMTIMIFASFVYYAEQIFEEDDNKFESILIGLWWAIVTMTTLGYGDIVPVTPFGYIIGGMCAISGLIFMSLPIPVIVNNFTTFYAQAKARQKLKEYTEAQKTLNYKAAFSTALQIQPSDVMKSSISGPHKGDSFGMLEIKIFSNVV